MSLRETIMEFSLSLLHGILFHSAIISFTVYFLRLTHIGRTQKCEKIAEKSNAGRIYNDRGADAGGIFTTYRVMGMKNVEIANGNAYSSG